MSYDQRRSGIKDEKVLNLLIECYQKKIFALVLYLCGGDRDKACDIATSSFVDVWDWAPEAGEDNVFFIKLATAAIKKSQDIKAGSSFDQSGFEGILPEKRRSLFTTRQALLLLSFDEKVLLLLRDQLHLSYKDIAVILQKSQAATRSETVKAQVDLRKKVKKILSGTE